MMTKVRTISFLAVLCTLLFSGQAQGREVRVNCDKPADPASNPHRSITSALEKLDPKGPNTVIVSGTCEENVLIEGFADLTLESDGATIIDASGGTLNIILIRHSQRITISGFSVNGGFGGLACVRSSDCIFNNNTIVGQALAGIFVFEHSAVTLSGNTLRNNADGVTALSHSLVVLLGGNIMEQNRRAGLAVLDSSHVVTAFGAGVDIFRDNVQVGVLTRNSVTRLFGPLITGNGNGADSDGGVRVLRGNLRLRFAEITGNTGQGIFLASGSNASINRSNISNNSRNGVVLVFLSTADFGSSPPNTISGNTSVDVFCDSTAILQNPSGISGATTVVCPNQFVGFGPIP